MNAGRSINGWMLIAAILIAIIMVSGVIIWSKYSRSQPVDISIVPDQELQGEIYIGGEVNNPGFYPLKVGDSIEGMLGVAGGVTDDADLSKLELIVPGVAEELPQKVNINKAETWLLETLPGIGEVRAKAIIDYRQRNGLFRSITDLVEVEGIGMATYDSIKHLITVAD